MDPERRSWVSDMRRETEPGDDRPERLLTAYEYWLSCMRCLAVVEFDRNEEAPRRVVLQPAPVVRALEQLDRAAREGNLGTVKQVLEPSEVMLVPEVFERVLPLVRGDVRLTRGLEFETPPRHERGSTVKLREVSPSTNRRPPGWRAAAPLALPDGFAQTFTRRGMPAFRLPAGTPLRFASADRRTATIELEIPESLRETSRPVWRGVRRLRADATMIEPADA